MHLIRDQEKRCNVLTRFNIKEVYSNFRHKMVTFGIMVMTVVKSIASFCSTSTKE